MRARSLARSRRSAASMASDKACARAANASGDDAPASAGTGSAPSWRWISTMRSTRRCRSRACVFATRCAALAASACAARTLLASSNAGRFNSNATSAACRATEPLR